MGNLIMSQNEKDSLRNPEPISEHSEPISEHEEKG
jgi:hypothetical protein